jgi:tetratricopeptide (TPR) repeat protein
MHEAATYPASRDEIFDWRTKARSLISFVAMTVVLVVQSASPQAAQDAESGATITGTVTDLSGRPVAGVPVLLQHRDGQDSAQTKTNIAGGFSFSRVQQGTYYLTADRAPLRSDTVTAVVSSVSDRRRVDLILKNATSGNPTSGAVDSFAQNMEFADKPNFTVAGVTDWTAAGGHGSDVRLRASEALTRETVTLRAGNKEAAAPTATPLGPDAAAAERALHAAVTETPESFEANRELGEFYVHAGRFTESVPFLKAAFRSNPGNRDNEQDLAVSLKEVGDFAGARNHVQSLLALADAGDLHRLAGEIDEKLGDPLSAVHEFEQAARKDPSEVNYFEWGSELLLHRAIWQAQEVLRRGTQAFPKSSRMLTALGVALFSGALYDEAALRLCEASDLSPSDPEPYIFMGKIEMAAPNPLTCVEQKLARFAETEPANALAVYYHAMAIWKQKGLSSDMEPLRQVESLLTRAVTLDPKCSEAYLQLGNLNYSQRNYEKAIGQYQKAIEVDPNSSEAHYRLGMAYDRTGDLALAKREFDLHDKIEKEQAAEVDRQRHEVKQFLVVEPDRLSPSPPN